MGSLAVPIPLNNTLVGATVRELGKDEARLSDADRLALGASGPVRCPWAFRILNPRDHSHLRTKFVHDGC